MYSILSLLSLANISGQTNQILRFSLSLNYLTVQNWLNSYKLITCIIRNWKKVTAS